MKYIFTLSFILAFLLSPASLLAQNTDGLQHQIELYDDMYGEAIRQNDFENAGKVLYDKLKAFFNSRMYDEVIKLAPDYMRFANKHELRTVYYQNCHILLWAYIQKGESGKALEEVQQMYEQAKQLKHNDGMALVLDVMAYIYHIQHRVDESEQLYRESIRLMQKEEALRSLLLRTYSDLIETLTNAGRFDEALQLCNEYEDMVSLHVQSGEANAATFANLYITYLLLYMRTGDFDKVEFYCNRIDSISSEAYAKVITNEAWILIYKSRKQYGQALEMADKTMEMLQDGRRSSGNLIRTYKMAILAEMNRAEEAHEVFWEYINEKDSIRNLEFNAQLDELRTQYELDRHIAEKERNRYYFLFALGGCVLLAIALGIWIFLNRQIKRKNRTLAGQIRELQHEHEIKNRQLLEKTTFQAQLPESDAGELCPESRKDKFCLALRDLLLKEKIYRDEQLSRDSLMERLGINRHDLDEAFLFCFNMQYNGYINLLRLNESLVLLEESDLSMEEISEKVGYGTLRTFQRQFQAKYDIPPKEYRKVMKERKN